MKTPLCSIIILSYHQFDYTLQCLDSIQKYTEDVSYEIIVIDNGSDQETIEQLKKCSGIRLVINGQNRGFAGGCNQGIELAEGKYVMLLNNDTIVTEKWLYHMVSLLEDNPEIEMTGPLTNATVGKQMIEVPYGEDMQAMQRFAQKLSGEPVKPWRTLRLVAFCVLIRKKIFQQIGMFDTNFVVGNYEDDDFNLKMLSAKKRMYICRNSFVHHFMNVSFRQKNIQREAIMFRNKQYLEEKWHHINWNYHAAFNREMLNEIINQPGRDVLHIGCGVGALAIELKDRDKSFYITGVEEHALRSQIAEQFIDQMISCDEMMQFLQRSEKKYDVVLVECMLEKWGPKLLGYVRKKLVSEKSLLILRIFNARHITTIEKAVTGQVGGGLLCAASDEFVYQYNETVEEEFLRYGFSLLKRTEVYKQFSNIQEELFEVLEEKCNSPDELRVYNRIYYLKRAI